MSELPSPAVLAAWNELAGAALAPFGAGLINRTLLAAGPRGKFVLQRLHPVFAGAVNEDIDAVTRHLQARRLRTPRVVPTADGRLWTEDADGRPWRMLTLVEGASHDRVDHPALAREAGRLVARFHAALDDFDHDYRHERAGVHDTARHLAKLEAALEAHRGHRLHARVAAAAEPLLRAARALPDLSAHPRRHAHGDLKLSNLLFDADRNGVCLVDLDTVGRMPWPHEMGDALRSWCNPAGEDRADAAIDAGLLRAALDGYADAAQGRTPPEDREALVAGLESICLELAARFLADALEESYFGWNPALHPTRGDHNLARGLGQLALGRSVGLRRAALEREVREAFAR